MKRWNGFLKIVGDAAIIACGMLACACAVPTAFSIPFHRWIMALGCGIGALLLSGWMHLPRGGVAPGFVYLLGTVIYGVLERKNVLFGVRWIAHTVTEPLARDFRFIPDISAPVLPEGMDFTYIATGVTTALLLLAAVVGILCAFSLIRGKTPLLSVLIPLPVFLLSLIYTDQPPAVWVVILLMVYFGGSLLGQGVRRGDSHRLGWYLVAMLPAMLIFALLLRVASPQSRFTPIPFEQRKEMLGDRVEELGDMILSLVRRNPKQYQLNKENERKERDDKAFSIRVSRRGAYLLRTHSYGQYADGTWQEAEAFTGDWRAMEALGTHATATAQLSVKDAFSGERYVPYGFKADPDLKMDESSVRASGKTSYDWTFATTVDLTARTVSDEERAYLDFVEQAYTMPDGPFRELLVSIARDAGIETSGSAYQTALSVAAFVRQSGAYSLTPGAAPDGRDMIEYFLTEGHKGYCVHFASATTALLQALDVPARYTIGYRANATSENAWFDVTEQTAHAWTEVYLAGGGWVPIESTAGFSFDLLGVSEPQQHSTPQATVAPAVPVTPEPTETPQATAPVGTPDSTAVPVPSADAQTTTKPQIIGEPNTITVHETHVSPWWLLLLLLPLLPAAWVGVGMLIRTRRRNLFRQKNAKQGVLRMLRYLKRLERFGVAPDPHAQEWAEEAVFSDHDMTETRKLLFAKVRKVQDTLYRESPIKRFLVKWILLAI